MRRAIASVVVTAMALTPACGPSWPKPVTVASPQLAASPVRSIDILPLDLEVWTHDRYAGDPDTVRSDAEAKILGTATEVMYQRGYTVGAVVDWKGQFVGNDGTSTVALEPAALGATLDSLSQYGLALKVSTNGVPAQYRHGPFQLPFPYLPARLGERTNSDATLYVGGWGFVGEEPDHAGTVAKIVIGAVLIVGIIAIAVIAAEAGKKGKGGGDLFGHTAKGLGHAAASVGRIALRAGMRAGNLILHTPTGPTGQDLVDLVDAFGHSHTHVQLVSGGRPEYSNAPDLPHQGRPGMYLEMTLVDNRTGEVLWHAEQRSPANPLRSTDVTRTTRMLLASLPRR